MFTDYQPNRRCVELAMASNWALEFPGTKNKLHQLSINATASAESLQRVRSWLVNPHASLVHYLLERCSHFRSGRPGDSKRAITTRSVNVCTYLVNSSPHCPLQAIKVTTIPTRAGPIDAARNSYGAAETLCRLSANDSASSRGTKRGGDQLARPPVSLGIPVAQAKARFFESVKKLAG